MGGENRKRDRTRRGLHKGNGVDTGRNDEHKGVNITKGNQILSKKHVSSLTYICLLKREKRTWK